MAIVLDFFITIGRLVNFKMLHPFSILKYIVSICVPAVIVTGISSFVTYNFFAYAITFGDLVINVFLTEIIMLVLIVLLGLNTDERCFLKQMIPFLKEKKNYE